MTREEWKEGKWGGGAVVACLLPCAFVCRERFVLHGSGRLEI